MGTIFLRRSGVCLLLGCGIALGPVVAWATKSSVKATVKAEAGSETRKPPSSVRFIDAPSSEKPAARERRLKRECKGRPNAGMCLGYTR